MLQNVVSICSMQPAIRKMKISGNIVDVATGIIHPGTIEAVGGMITGISRDTNHYDTYILPGFVDAHVHIESSMLTPYEFARIAMTHGTVASVSDPHEIANVLGMEGIRYMIEDARRTPFRFCFGAPSCVPATPFESSGAVLGITETEDLLNDGDIGYLSEMMNFPGVINGDSEVMAKIGLAHRYGKPVDGHAPGLSASAGLRHAAQGPRPADRFQQRSARGRPRAYPHPGRDRHPPVHRARVRHRGRQRADRRRRARPRAAGGSRRDSAARAGAGTRRSDSRSAQLFAVEPGWRRRAGHTTRRRGALQSGPPNTGGCGRDPAGAWPRWPANQRNPDIAGERGNCPGNARVCAAAGRARRHSDRVGTGRRTPPVHSASGSL